VPTTVMKRSRSESAKLSVSLVCCGEPKKSMGWFHLTQLLEHESVEVAAVVEPYFLGVGKGKPGTEAFDALMAANPSVQFYPSVEELPACAAGSPHLFLIAGRTVDAPKLFSAVITKGATHIYMEKPGAESAAKLSDMRALAAKHAVEVIVGYNKNVAEYSREALSVLREAAAPRPSVTLEHCNDFAPGEGLVTFLRGPGGEGCLHNMACHELALAATLFAVTVARVRRVILEKERSELLDLGDGRYDWKCVAFRIEVDAPADEPPSGSVALDELNFVIDRCGGNFSRVVLTGGDGEPKAFRLPSPEFEEIMTKAQAEDPLIRPYFLQQGPDYERLKGEFIGHILAGNTGIPSGVVGLDAAIEALRLADFLAPRLRECWKSGQPWVKADAS